MICVECGNPRIKQLYSEYKSSHITLTICPECRNVADKYIEYDRVLLFIDILLLKPQAYRHLAFNLSEEQLLSQLEGPLVHRYRLAFRLFVVFVLFDVYLVWAHEERQQHHSPAMAIVLSQTVLRQYLFFVTRLAAEVALQSFCTIFLCRRALGWGSQNPYINIPHRFQRGYSTVVLLMVFLVASSIKLFPILMLIWPYDASAQSLFIINIIAFFTLVEAVTMTLQKPRWRVLLICLASSVSRLLFSAGFTVGIVGEKIVGRALVTELREMVPR